MLSSKQMEILRSAPVFRDCGALPDWFTGSLDAVTFEAGRLISPPGGTSGGAAGIVLSGRAVAESVSGVVLNEFGEGDTFGVVTLFGSGGYVSVIRAVSQCEIVFLTTRVCERLFLEDAEAALSYIRFLTGRVRFLNARIAAFTANTAADALLTWARENARDGIAEANRGWSALARSLGIGRASLYRAIDELEREGKAVRVGERGIKVIEQSE